MKAVLIYPHQLFESHPSIDLVYDDYKNSKEKFCIILIEDYLYFSQYKFHKQKLILHRASMQNYQKFLEDKYNNKNKVCEIIYIESQNKSQKNLDQELESILLKNKIKNIYAADVIDNYLEKNIKKVCHKNNIDLIVQDTPMFLLNQKDIENYNQKLFMKTFYEWQRKRLNILVDKDDKPIGGKWSFDTENRLKLPKNISLPEDYKCNKDAEVIEATKYLEKYFPDNYGYADNFIYPINFKDAKVWLHKFLKEKLENFGPYEDAITIKNNTLFHSLLSPLLNIGLLTPKYVIDETLKYYENNKDINFASLEGFIRQIIGWREYMRLVYIKKGVEIRNKNYFKHDKQIPEFFWQGQTNVDPIDNIIKNALQIGYSHHIERLMVLGNFMNLCEFHPDEVYKWFMTMYVDAYDWVMVANVYSMALYADGGIITTKPYISGSNYILKMSDYKKGEWSDIWDALFWHFVGKNSEVLSKEGRLGFIGITYGKMSKEKRDNYNSIAKKFLDKL